MESLCLPTFARDSTVAVGAFMVVITTHLNGWCSMIKMLYDDNHNGDS